MKTLLLLILIPSSALAQNCGLFPCTQERPQSYDDLLQIQIQQQNDYIHMVQQQNFIRELTTYPIKIQIQEVPFPNLKGLQYDQSGLRTKPTR